MPNAQCPMPNAPCPMPHAPTKQSSTKISNNLVVQALHLKEIYVTHQLGEQCSNEYFCFFSGWLVSL
ncbi:hypothetical protein [Nostoc sp.]